MQSDPIIDIKEVSKTYENARHSFDTFLWGLIKAKTPHKQIKTQLDFALKRINLSIKSGESVGIIGLNGSGKSTLLQIICGILPPSEGNVFVKGKVGALLELGAGFNPNFTGRQNIIFLSAALGVSKKETERMIPEIIDFADIGNFIDKAVKTYSSGMFLRLAFATNIFIKPDILIVDEALAVGDVFFQQKCVSFIKDKLKRQTKILVSHDLSTISNLCDRVLVLDRGEISFDGPTKQGIELFLRTKHSDRTLGRQSPQITPSNNAISSRKLIHEIPNENKGGLGDADILRFDVFVDGNRTSGVETTVYASSVVTLVLEVRFLAVCENPILGYFLRDRHGQQVFGDNTCWNYHPSRIIPGVHFLTIEFIWPDVAPQAYTLTLGIGDGLDPFEHQVCCWAHSVFQFWTAKTSPVHGIFANRITSFEVS
jgi:ABC-type polysaccharide/polyol phosphate transport system ATPase subunit